MNIKILIQLLLFIILVSTAATYYYFYNNKTNANVNKINNNKISINKNSSNLIKNISYASTDNLGNKFIIKSETGEISIDNPKFVYMTNVKAIINLINSDPIIIKSNHAKYNKINYETNFKENVLLTYQTHKITSQNLDLSFENNLATIYNKIVYDNNNVKISADILEIDLITKNSRIFMNNEYKKIKITTNK
jgi:hypothetical protein|tara:strand:+ start:211 stop:789 length:579 start_codon:yes stop_codon:yes gene_type:complete